MATGQSLKKLVGETAMIGAQAQLRVVLEADPDVVGVSFTPGSGSYCLVNVKTQSEGLRSFELKLSEPR